MTSPIKPYPQPPTGLESYDLRNDVSTEQRDWAIDLLRRYDEQRARLEKYGPTDEFWNDMDALRAALATVPK